MKIYFDNVDFRSSSGPNTFAFKLAHALDKKGHTITSADAEIQLSFITTSLVLAPVVQRLDGIYFNSEQDWESLNDPIKKTYDMSAGVIFQSKFNKELTERYFGKKPNFKIVHNGTDLEKINHIPKLDHEVINKFDRVWSCASSWRPHKRLSENIRYFLEFSGPNDCLVVAGTNATDDASHPRIFYTGHLSWEQLISLYKRSAYFIHLALMDHCPNVVVDAKASGCQIICTDSGGTLEIAGSDAIIIPDIEWDYQPFELYKPPSLDFSKANKNTHSDLDLSIYSVADKYTEFFNLVREGL